MEPSRDMMLTEFRLQMYKNFIDSGGVEVDSEATVLVGKNEAGKTTLLDALWRLSPANPPARGFDFTLDYPRWLKKEYETQDNVAALPPISATFQLSDAFKKQLEEMFGSGILRDNRIIMSRMYDGEVKMEAAIDEAAWARSFASGHPAVWPDPTTANSVNQLREDLENFEAQIPTQVVADAPPNGEDDPQPVEDPGEDARTAYDSARKALDAVHDGGSLRDQVLSALAERAPKYFYFNDVFLLPASVSIESIRNAVLTGDETGLSDADVAAARFLRSVKLDPSNLEPDNFEALRAELEAVGNLLTDKVQKFWHQNPHLEFKVEPENIEGQNPHGERMIVDRRLHFRVNDRRHRVTTSFSTRSTGFRWFVSFLAQFSYYAEGRKDVIILLDEPAVSLHAKAQADLLGYIDEELVPSQQVIYTTHSAWMVPVRRIHRVRTVEEDLAPEISTGATVSARYLAKDRDTLMPLQAALGYDVAQTLFVGPDSLVVEGISEILYLYDMSDLLAAEGREGLNPRWHLCPAGSVGRIPAMLGLLGNSVDTTVLIDSPANPTERGNIEDRLYDETRLIEVGAVTGTLEADIEDLIDPTNYLTAFNSCFGTSIKTKDLSVEVPRMVRRVEEIHGPYNHGNVARAWVKLRACGDLVVADETKGAFEALFRRVNRTLTVGASPSTDPARSMLDAQLADGAITQEQHASYVARLGK